MPGRAAASPAAVAVVAVVAVLATGCSSSVPRASTATTATTGGTVAAPATSATTGPSSPTSGPATTKAPASPRTTTGARGVYGGGSPQLSSRLSSLTARVYVPNGGSGTVTVIDARSRRVVATYPSRGALPQHVVPSYDLTRLWVLNNLGDSLLQVDPGTGRPLREIPVDDPYNLYYTPDGSSAIVVAEAQRRLDFRDPSTMARRASMALPCAGGNHMDYAGDFRYALLTCEFAGRIVKLDLVRRQVLGTLVLGNGNTMPQDIRVAPDGTTFYAADMRSGGVWVIDGDALAVRRFIPTGEGAHGLYPSRDARRLFVTNRGQSDQRGLRRQPASVSVLDFRTGAVLARWPIPGGGSPDMGGLSVDGSELWLSGRYDSEVYVLSTTTGALLARIPVGSGPHGLAYWPQPGALSLGHTGNMR